ncbi:BRO-N domain-containing protein [Bacillus mycoides]|uniref:BRO-N domain-containing protein n=1 Tax=Bacillus mycoides TaxID=1405 RepID=UPI0024AE250E|nr:Bro-N domain-containing protein [Bacillus mycoides]MDI6531626.1 Bro-N domain-containing protein [Bacillus mycoides]WJE59659.1 Bro-N domain-containing protein [Bacillus mycoides]
MSNLQVIHQQEVLGQGFKVYGTVEEPLFLAKDVAEWIEHSNQRMMLASVDEDEKQCVNNPYASSGNQQAWFLTENGIYEVLMLSRKPIAKQWKKEDSSTIALLYSKETKEHTTIPLLYI